MPEKKKRKRLRPKVDVFDSTLNHASTVDNCYDFMLYFCSQRDRKKQPHKEVILWWWFRIKVLENDEIRRKLQQYGFNKVKVPKNLN